MKKLNFDGINKKINENKLKKELKDYYGSYLVTDSNLIDCITHYTEQQNCKMCKSLDNCQNHQKGYLFDFNNFKFSFKPCKYLLEENAKIKRYELYKVFYYPESVKNANINDFFINSKIRMILRQYHDKLINDYKNKLPFKNLFLTGENNIGKTYYLSCLCNSFVEEGFSSSIVYVPDLSLNLKNSFNVDGKIDAIMNHLRNVDLLCLDDIGAEAKSQWFRDDILSSLINLRNKDNKLTCFSSNLTPDQLKAFYSEYQNDASALRIYNRVISSSYVVQFTKD